ncbi:MAG: hypothetical protein WCO09_04110 [bacterium]
MVGFSKSTVTFSPAEVQPNGFNPLILREGTESTPITLTGTTLKPRRMEFNRPDFETKIKAVEHYAPLRFLFPRIIISGQGRELPHFTCSFPIIESLMRRASPLEVETPWFTTKETCVYQYEKQRGGIDAFTVIEPGSEKKLVIDVTVRFPRFGEMNRCFTFPDEKLLLQVLSVTPLGNPRWLEWPAKLLWAHGRETYWPNGSDEEILEAIVLHRVHDILGALALIESPIAGSFPSLNVYSQCSGHLADHHALCAIKTVPLC